MAGSITFYCLILMQVLTVYGQTSSHRCYSLSDMIFLVSTSNQNALVATSIKNEITDFIARFNIVQNETRIALATSGKHDYISFYLDSIPDNKTANLAIAAAPYITQGEEPDLMEEIEVIKSLVLNKTHGDRDNVTNLWFVITDQTPDDYTNRSLLELVNGTKNQRNIFFFISLTSLDKARLWAIYATRTDFVMDLENMDLLSTSMMPFLHWECQHVKIEKPPEKDILCLNESCSNCRFSDNNVAICSCDGGISSKYCYKEQPRQTGYSSRARCRSGHGVTEESVITMDGTCPDAIVDTICPGFGPESGGTDIFIWGRKLTDSLKKVYLWPFECDVVYSNRSFIHCVSNPIDGTDAHSSYLSLQVETSDGCKIRTRGAFVYYRNPRIKSVQPTTTLVSGGFTTTVKGENLQNVANIILEVTAVYEDVKQMYSSGCTVINQTVATCIYPEMHLPGVDNQRSKRSTDDERTKQQETLDKYKFYIGFKMDGVKSYKNMSKVSSTDGLLSVHLDPEVDNFPDEEDGRFIMNYRPGWPDEMSSITIRGKGLNATPSGDALNVTLGGAICKTTEIADEYVVCVPPDDEPDGPTLDDLHILYVQIYHFKISPGYVRYDTSLWNNSTSRAILIVVIVIAVLIVIFLIVFGIICIRKRSRKKNEEKAWGEEKGYVNKAITKQEKNEYLIGEYLDPHTTLKAALTGNLKTNVEGCQLDPNKVEKGRLLSRGAHGLIYTGWLLNDDKERLAKVKIKTFDHDVPFRHIKEFLEEATQLKNLEHQNVLSLAGVLLDDRVPMAVSQFTKYGDLKGFLMDIRRNPEKSSLKQKIQFCIDICHGMNFIMENGIVHEDLAARNCVVDEDYTIKVADATLSRDIYELEYYKPGEKARALPVKWMSPEALEHELFTSKGDVWSFGVVMWEIFTLAATPYPEIQNSDMRNHIRTGVRLEKPEDTPVALYTVMLHCWAKEPNKRSSFNDLAKTLQDVSTDKPALSKTSLLPLDHFAIPDATTSATVDTGMTLSEDNDVLKRETSSSNGDIRKTDSVIISQQLGDTRL